MGFPLSISSPHLNPIQKLQLKWSWMEPGSPLRVGKGRGCNATMLPLSQLSPRWGRGKVRGVFQLPPHPCAPFPGGEEPSAGGEGEDPPAGERGPAGSHPEPLGHGEVSAGPTHPLASQCTVAGWQQLQVASPMEGEVAAGGGYIAACGATGCFAGSGGGSWVLCPAAPAVHAIFLQAAVGGAPGRPRGTGEGGAAAGAGSPREGGAAVPRAQRRRRLPIPHRCQRGAPHRHIARRRPAPHTAGRGAVGAFLRSWEPRTALTSAPAARAGPRGS